MTEAGQRKTAPYELKLATFKKETNSDVSPGVGRRAAVVNVAPPSGPSLRCSIVGVGQGIPAENTGCTW